MPAIMLVYIFDQHQLLIWFGILEYNLGDIVYTDKENWSRRHGIAVPRRKCDGRMDVSEESGQSQKIYRI